MKLPVSAKSGLSAPGARAPGFYGEPTAAQVERLIAAARGEEYKPPEKVPLYSKPTYAQLERLIAAIGAASGAVSEALAGESMPAVPTQLELTEAVKTIFKALGGDVDPAGQEEE